MWKLEGFDDKGKGPVDLRCLNNSLCEPFLLGLGHLIIYLLYPSSVSDFRSFLIFKYSFPFIC